MDMLQDLRSKFPQYNDMSDDELAGAFHQKFYADMPREQFNAKIGLPMTDWSQHKDWDQSKAFIEGLPEDQREAARKDWASNIVKSERAKGGVGQFVDDTVRRLARGVPIVGGLADEGNALIASGLGYDYDMQLAYERAKDAVGDQEAPVTSFATQLAGGIATAPLAPFARGATTLGDIGLGAAQGAGYAGAHGFMTGEGGAEKRLENAAESGIAGAVLGAAVPVVANGVQAVRRAVANQGQAGAYGSIAQDIEGGTDVLADQVAAGASRGNVATNRRTLDILGEEMERAGGDVQRAQQATINRISQEFGIAPNTAAGHIRRLTQVHEDSPLMLGEYPAVAASDAAQRLRRPGNVDLDELGRLESTGTQGKIDYLANNGNAQSAHNVRNALSVRQETLAPAMRETLDEFAPRVATGARTARPATIEDTADLVQTARQLARQEYDAAYNGPVATPQRLQQLPRFFEYLANRAATSSPDVAATIRRAVDQFTSNATQTVQRTVRDPMAPLTGVERNVNVQVPHRRVVQSLRELQQGRTTLRGQMDALDRSGRADLAREIRPLYNLLTRTMEEMSPAWAVANRRWADMNLAQVAQDLGDAFSTKAGPQFREQLAQFQHLAPEAQDIVRIHVLQKLSDKLDNLGDAHSISKLFSNDASRNLIRQLFGDQAAVAFTRAVRDQKVAEQSQSMLRNSATHRRGVAQKQADAETGLVAAVENANARGVKNWLLERMTQVLTERRNRPMADILTTPMADTATVARHLHNMRRQQERLQQFANQPDTSRAVVAPSALVGGRKERADGGRVIMEDLPRLPPLPGSSPSLMGDALATSDWGEPSTDYPDTVSGRVARTTDKFKDDVQFLREHPGDVGSAALAGLIDFGGATSKISNYLGQGDTAKAIERNKEKAPGVAGVAGMTPLALPGILAEGAEGAYQTANPEPPVNVISRDEFFQARRKPRETLEQAAARAEKEFRESPTYIDLNKRNMVKVANRELSNAVERAKQTWKESQSGIGGEEKAIEADYQAYLQDMNKKLEAEHAKGFSERNPWFKTVVGLGSLASGGLAALGLRSIAKKGDKLLDAAAAAKATGDAEKMSRAKMALEHWDKWRLPKQTLAVGLPATVPMDVRGLADVVDAYGLPQTYFDAEGNIQPVLANERAREHLKPENFVADSLPAIASGLIGAGVGAKFARKAPTEAVSSQIKPLPQSALDDVAGLETANAAASAKIAQARQALAAEKQSLDSKSRVHEQQLARSEATARRSSPANRPAELSPQSGQGSKGPSQPADVSGGTTKALPSPKATDATKNKFWDDVQAALKEGRDITTLKAEDYPGLTDRMLKERFTRVKSLQGRKTPKALANLIEQIRKNDSWKLGVAGATTGAAGVASMDGKTE